MTKKEILQGLDGNLAYDFIANNYWQIDTEDLRDIILELIAMYDREDWDYAKDKLIENLCEYKNWDLEE